MPAAVVEPLEIVHIHIEEGDWLRQALRSAQGSGEVALEGTPIAEAGQRVREGQSLELGEVADGGALFAPNEVEDPAAEDQGYTGPDDFAGKLTRMPWPVAMLEEVGGPGQGSHQDDEGQRDRGQLAGPDARRGTCENLMGLG